MAPWLGWPMVRMGPWLAWRIRSMSSVWPTVRTGPSWLGWASVHKPCAVPAPSHRYPPCGAQDLLGAAPRQLLRVASAATRAVLAPPVLPVHPPRASAGVLPHPLHPLHTLCTLCTHRPTAPPATPCGHEITAPPLSLPRSSSGTTSGASITTSTPWRLSPCSCSRARRPTAQQLSTPCTPSQAT